MQNFSFEETFIEDLFVITPFLVEDFRGKFIKFYEKEIFAKNNIDMDEVYEGIESVSKKGVLRGLHFQTDGPQAKLIRVPYGKIMDVVVDLRRNSKTFGKYYSANLSGDNSKMLFVPKGFAHGFVTLSDIAIVSYLIDGKYSKETDTGIIWNDATLNIDWKLDRFDNVIISERDSQLGSFQEFCKINKF